MDELDEGLKISLRGEAAKAALRRFRAQAEKWGIALPDVEPLVLDFGLNDFPRTGLVEYWIANEAEAGYCGKYLYVSDGQSCPLHEHRMKHETFFVVKGRVTVSYQGRDIALNEGQRLAITPGTLHGFTGNGPAFLLELSMPCEVRDNYFADRRIPIGGNYRP